MKALLIFFIVVSFLFSVKPVFAQSDYVLPYPSAMPGSVWYKLELVQEKLNQYWYFGNFAQFHYHLKLADKYLVEAKTLFEYKQYLLAYEALQKSDEYFQQTKPFLQKAAAEGKVIAEKEALLQSAALKHKGVLTAVLGTVPEQFVWTPEKEQATTLNLQHSIRRSIELRDL